MTTANANSAKLPEVTLTRKCGSHGGTWGILSYPPANLVLHTMERAWVDNKRGISCIPCGRYKVVATMSNRFGRRMYLVLGTSPREGIRIHAANLPSQLQGCIALGTAEARYPSTLKLLNSRVAVGRLEAVFGMQPFYLTIVQSEDYTDAN